MKKISILASILLMLIALNFIISCNNESNKKSNNLNISNDSVQFVYLDTAKIPKNKYGEAVRYGRELMLHTAYYIGPEGTNGKYLGNKMNCTNCHQNAGTKPFSFNLQRSFLNYPQYRAREGKVLTMEERVNNCITHPHLGTPLQADSKEMIAFVSYLKWISDSSNMKIGTPGLKNIALPLMDRAASSEKGGLIYTTHCQRCHGKNGEGIMQADQQTYLYPPLWGNKAYQPGSSMHRVVLLAQWVYTNMPYGLATHHQPVLTAEEAFDVAAFINDDAIHQRPTVKDFEYPFANEKPIDYDKGPYPDGFTEKQHKYGPYQPIVDFWKSKGLKISF